MGHIRDLPNSASEIPESLKKEKWAKLGVNTAGKFEPLYIIPPNKQQHVKALRELLKDAKQLYLATDEDREGESISWHIVETLKPKIPYQRLVFHEITKEAIKHSLESPREIDENLVKAQETRRIVDRLFGYEVSPILWKKMAPGLSAGRVQSVAVRLLVERERERIKFRKAEYWGLKAVFAKESNDTKNFDAELTHVGGDRVATGKDFDPTTGKLSSGSGVVLLDESRARKLADNALRSTAVVSSVEEKPFTSKPSAPFVTSSLQQDANRKLRFSAKRTMSIAQQLYENGFITYMRTDSTTLSEEALTGARRVIEREFGKEFLVASTREYATKVKNAQEAHEAIRPAGVDFAAPEVVRTQLGEDAFRLYDLIWKRTVASQMPDARGTHIAVQIDCGEAKFRATGKTIEFPGFLRAYVESSDDPEAEIADQEKILPKLTNGEKLKTEKVEPGQHFTQPAPRYTEGSLIKELERLGIGRPSTWASVVEVVLNRSYAFKKGTALVPTFVAMAVIGLLERHFPTLLDFEFTARLEDDLDAISRGEAGNLEYLKSFYFGNGRPGLKTLVSTGVEEIDPRIVCGIPLGNLANGDPVEVRIGRYGPFVSDGKTRDGVPDMTAPDELTVEEASRLLELAARGPQPLGKHPETNEFVYLKSGRFGPYVQLGEASDGVRPKMVSLPPNVGQEEVDLAKALEILSLPRTLGEHPEMKQPIVAALGKFGPYIKSGDETRSISGDEYSVLSINLEQAIELLKQPKGQRRSSKPKPLKELGPHPTTQAPLVVLTGRFGPYVTDGKINASLTRGMDPTGLTMDQAVNLLEMRADKIAADEAAGIVKTKKSRGRKVKAADAEAKPAPKKKRAKKADKAADAAA